MLDLYRSADLPCLPARSPQYREFVLDSVTSVTATAETAHFREAAR